MEKLSNGTVKRIRIQKIKEWTRFGFESEIRWRWGDITVTVRRVHIRVLLKAPLLTPNPDYIIITSGGEQNKLRMRWRRGFFFSADRDANEGGCILCIVIAYLIWRMRLKVGTFFNWVGQASLGWCTFGRTRTWE
jgi:hypothetical protein